MNSVIAVPEDIVGLLLGYQDDALSPRAAERLAAWLQDTTQAAAARAWLAEQHLLARAISDRDDWLSGQALALARARQPSRRQRQLAAIDRARRRRSPRRSLQTRLLLAAALLVSVGAATLAWWSGSSAARSATQASWTIAGSAAVAIDAGETCRLSAAQAGRLRLADESLVVVTGPADFKLATGPQHGLDIGHGRFLVHAAPQDPRRPLRLRSGQGTVSVLGTRFLFAADSERLQVRVEEGRVEVEGADDGRWQLAVADMLTRDPAGVRRGSWLDGTAPWRLFHPERVHWRDDSTTVTLDPDPASGWQGYGAWFPRPLSFDGGLTLAAELRLPPVDSATRVAVVFSCTDDLDATDGAGQFEPDRFGRLQIIDRELAFLHDPGDHDRRRLEPLSATAPVGEWFPFALELVGNRMTASLAGRVVGSSTVRLPPGPRWLGLRIVADDDRSDAPAVRIGLRRVRLRFE